MRCCTVTCALTCTAFRCRALAKYFGEDLSAFSPRDFFGHVAAFVEQFERALDEIRQLKGERAGGNADGGKEDYMTLFQELRNK